MKTFIARQYRNPNAFVIKDLPGPIPKSNQICVKLKATTVSSGDARILMLDFPMRFQIPFRLMMGVFKPRKVLGLAFSGVVESVGSRVTQFQVGDAVFGSTEMAMGCHADFICIKEKDLVLKKPANKSHDQAAAFYFGANTAYAFLKQAKLERGQQVLIYGASGAVGAAAVQLAVHLGAQVTAVCGPDNQERVKSLGAQQVLDYKAQDFSKTSDKYDVVFDTVGYIDLEKAFSVLKPTGVLVSTSHLDSDRIKEGKRLIKASGNQLIAGMVSTKKADFVHLHALFEEGVLDPVIDSTYSIEQLNQAFERVLSGRKRGNVVINF